MMLIYLFLALIISGVCNQDGVWTKCKPKPGCTIGKCDPIPFGRIVAGGFRLKDNEFPILCQHQETVSSDTTGDLHSRMAKFEKMLQASERKITALEMANTELKTKMNKEILPWPLDCTKVDGKIPKVKNSTGGVFVIFPSNFPTTEVYCDLTTDGDGWTVFQRRMDGSVNFNTNWEDYVNGFGSPDKEYWMGLDKLHRLTSDGNYELRVDLEDWEGNRAYAKYSMFAVAGISEKYRLRVGGYSGDAGDSLTGSEMLHDNLYFSALDRDNDKHGSSCSITYKGGWWFNGCFRSHLNGVYHDQRSGAMRVWQGIIWNSWKGKRYSLKFTEMKFRQIQLWVLDCTKVEGSFPKVKNSTGGVFVIFPSINSPTEVYCDLTTDGGGWTVFQRRLDGSVNFTRNWEDYVNGFGSPDKEYWMGLEKLHRLTSDGDYELRVDLEDWEGNRAYAKYSIFAVAGASDKYRLRVGGYSGSAGNSLNNQGTSSHDHDGQFFSTSDRDNDKSGSSCSQVYKGGWWFNSCFYANLNGVYRDQRSDSGSAWQGITWYHWKRSGYSLKFAEMKFRRKN